MERGDNCLEGISSVFSAYLMFRKKVVESQELNMDME